MLRVKAKRDSSIGKTTNKDTAEKLRYKTAIYYGTPESELQGQELVFYEGQEFEIYELRNEEDYARLSFEDAMWLGGMAWDGGRYSSGVLGFIEYQTYSTYNVEEATLVTQVAPIHKEDIIILD